MVAKYSSWRLCGFIKQYLSCCKNFWDEFYCLFLKTDPVQGHRPPEGVRAVAESVEGQGREKEGQGHAVERGEGLEKGTEGMADTDQRLCVNSFHVNMYFTYMLQNIFVINQMCSFSLSNKISTYSLHVLFAFFFFCFTCTLYTNCLIQ